MSCSGWGPQIDLTAWFYDQTSVLTHLVFLCGPSEEELVVIDSSNYMRIFSLATGQCRYVPYYATSSWFRFNGSYRPSSIMLPQSPSGLYSAPDGSCVFVACTHSDSISLHAYHSSTFGHSEGIILELEGLSAYSNVITCIGTHAAVYYLGLHYPQRQCKSFALDITSKTAEFNFRERHPKRSGGDLSRKTSRNSLLDCLSDVWTRFPVVAAIERSTSGLIEGNKAQLLSFVASTQPTLFRDYLRSLISDFERTTKKPTENILADMIFDGMSYDMFREMDFDQISTHKCGQWLVNLLCLIPIHLAVAWNNQFIPLKDGVWSREFDRSLLGATVEQIVDGLSVGWYESIFKSYMGSKVVHTCYLCGKYVANISIARSCRVVNG